MAGSAIAYEARGDFLADSYPAMPSMSDTNAPDDDGLLSAFSHASSILANGMPAADPSHHDIDHGFSTETNRAAIGLHTPLSGPISLPDTSMGTTQSPAALAAASLGVAQAQARENPGNRGKKPDRNPVKGPDGLYRCQFPGCKEEPFSFPRKCEWNKHMDKHERPYRCLEPGCEKLIGFTYSGGLARHEREVHGKHGGPKNTVNCPHENCKRHTGKGFSRQENLNEHLRRVHAEGASGHDGSASSVNGSPVPHNVDDHTPKLGEKRKLETSEEQDDAETRIRRLEMENTMLTERMEMLVHENKEVKMQLATLQHVFHNQVAQQVAQQVVQLPDPTPNAAQEQPML